MIASPNVGQSQSGPSLLGTWRLVSYEARDSEDRVHYPLGENVSTNLINPLTHGLTFRYGIFIRADYWNQRPLLVHQLVHTSQYERLGGFEGYLRPYLLECITPPGYPLGPMEQEAVTTATRLCA